MKKYRKLMIRAAMFLAIMAIGGVVMKASSADLPEGWLKDFEKATAQSKATNKPILAVFSAAWCGPCQMMVKEVYPLESVKKTLKDFVPVYTDVDEHGELAEKYKIQPIPTFVIISPSGEEEDRFTSAMPEKQFIDRLKNYKVMATRLSELKTQLDKNPKDAALWKELGDLHLKRDHDEEKAIAAYEKAAANDPEDKTGVADDIYLYKAVPKEEADLAGAAKKFAEFETKFPKSDLIAKAIFFHGLINADLKKTNEAISIINDGLKRFPDSDYADREKQILEMLQKDKDSAGK